MLFGRAINNDSYLAMANNNIEIPPYAFFVHDHHIEPEQTQSARNEFDRVAGELAKMPYDQVTELGPLLQEVRTSISGLDPQVVNDKRFIDKWNQSLSQCSELTPNQRRELTIRTQDSQHSNAEIIKDFTPSGDTVRRLAAMLNPFRRQPKENDYLRTLSVRLQELRRDGALPLRDQADLLRLQGQLARTQRQSANEKGEVPQILGKLRESSISPTLLEEILRVAAE